MLGSGHSHREDGQMHRELQGTRILRSSRATPHRQRVIVINIFSLNYMMCIGERKRDKGKDTQGDETQT